MNRFSALLITAIALCAISACETVENIRIIQQTNAYTDGPLEITASFLDKATLIARYGANNPFLPPLRLITPIDFLVIELSISGPDDYDFIRSRDIKLKFNDVQASPVSIDRLLTIWENHIDIHGTDSVRSNYRTLVRGLLASRDIHVNTTKLLLFQGNFPFEGNAILSIPHLNPAESQISTLKSAEDSNNNPIEPVFDGELIHFNFAIRNEQHKRSFFGF